MILYGAYGSNLNLSQMKVRCPNAEPFIRCYINNWRLVFKGVADIEKAPGYKLTLEVDINLTNNSNNTNFKRKFSKDMSFNSKNSKFELDQYRLNLEKNMISQILQEINLYLKNLENDL